MSGAPSEKKPADLSSAAQSLLADLVGDDSTRGFVLLPGLLSAYQKTEEKLEEKTEEKTEEADIAPDFIAAKQPHPQYVTAANTDLPPQPGDALLQMMADVEADRAETSADAPGFTEAVSGKAFASLPEENNEENNGEEGDINNIETDTLPPALVRLRGILRQSIGRGNNDAGVLVGTKDVKKTFQLETTASPLPKTLMLSFLLLLVAAVPPVMNFGYIQPTISDYNLKIDKIAVFEARIKQNAEMSDNLSVQIKNLQRRSEALAATLISQQRYDFILQKFIAAFEQYGGEIISVTNQIDPESSLQLGKAVNVSVNIVTMEIESRYEIYRSIREIFMKEIKSVYVIEEVLTTKPNSNVLKIKLKMAVAYGGEK